MIFQNSISTNNPGTDSMINTNANIRDQSISIKTGFLFCPRCGLRRPKSENLDYYGGHCPYCGYRMIDEYYIPYNSKKSKPLLFPRQIGNNMMRQVYFPNQLPDNSI